jgi:hypothetical protein
MCLFVPEPLEPGSELGTVHVLMPKTSCCHGAGAGVPEHVVRLIHDDVARPKGVSLAGWTLELGGARGEAKVALDPQLDPNTGFMAEIVDLTKLTKLRVDRRRLEHGAEAVNAHVAFRRGHLNKIEAEQVWVIGGEDVFMAYRMTWRIDGVSEDQVKWTGPNGETVGPVDILNLTPGGDGQDDKVIRFGIHHQPDRVLVTPRKPRLKPTEVTAHFRAFYSMFDVRNPDEFLLPEIKFDIPPGDNVHCGGGRALLA